MRKLHSFKRKERKHEDCQNTGVVAVAGNGPGPVGMRRRGAQVQATSTTMGQELQDLKKSLDEGIITEKEYERAKKDILKKYD